MAKAFGAVGAMSVPLAAGHVTGVTPDATSLDLPFTSLALVRPAR